MSLTTHLDFLGAHLVVESDLPKWADLWARAFPAYVQPAGDATRCFRVRIRTCENPHVAHDLPQTCAGIQPDGLYGEVFEDGERFVHTVGDAVAIEVDCSTGLALVQVKPDGARSMLGSAMMQLVDACMGYFDRFLLHAGALVDPKSGKAVLLSVKSGGGKTTTSLALSRHGFGLMTDDATVLGFENGQPIAWGLPRPLKVHRKTAEMLPWVGPLPDEWDEHGEQGVQLSAIADRVSIAGPEGVPLGAIIEIGPRSAGAHVLSSWSKPEAVIALAHENVAGRALGVTPRARRRFMAITRAVAAARTFRLSAGTDLESLPALIAARLDGTAVA